MRIILNHKKHIALMVCILLCMLMTWKTFSTTLAASDTAAATDIQSEDTDDKLEGYCTFYDYNVAPYSGNMYSFRYKEYPDRSINCASNYKDNGKPKLTVGTYSQNYSKNRHKCMVNGLDVNTCIYYNNGIAKTSGTFNGEEKTYSNSSPGIIAGLDKNNYKNVLFNVDEPGLFSDDIKMGKTILNDYKLSFDKKDNGNHSMTYTLKSVTSPDGDVTYAGDNFFPLNNAKSNTLDKGYASADGKNSTNYYFGMRYDLSFTLNGYTGDLLYKFTGDDDLWVFLDGELVLDLGGIHAECGGDVDLWRVGPLADELYATGNKELVNADTKHTLTVLYMERGGNESNCNMQFTVPDTVTIDPPHEDYEWNVEKNVILTDWDNRTYDITLDVTSDKVYKEVISGALIRDYIDNRFNILDDNGRAITKDIIDNSNEDIYVNSGRIGYDYEYNLIYIEWNNQELDFRSNNDASEVITGWEKVIKIKAKEAFLGGNNVATNGENSYVTVKDTTKNFNVPHVNVKVIPVLKDVNEVVFYGDYTTGLIQKLKDIFNYEDYIGEDGKVTDENDYTIQWSKVSKEGNETLIDKDLSDMQEISTDRAQHDSGYNYYVRVFYNNLSDVCETDECSINSLGNIANGTIYNKDKDSDGNIRDYAVYNIRIVRGRLDITKYINERYTDNEKINANETFVFKIQQYEAVKMDGGYTKGRLVNTFYETISFDANSDVSDDTAIITGLKMGFYTITEQTKQTPLYMCKDINDNYTFNENEGVDMFIGKKLNTDNNGKIEFFGLDNNRYKELADGDSAKIEFKNVKDNSKHWLCDSSSVRNGFVR